MLHTGNKYTFLKDCKLFIFKTYTKFKRTKRRLHVKQLLFVLYQNQTHLIHLGYIEGHNNQGVTGLAELNFPVCLVA